MPAKDEQEWVKDTGNGKGEPARSWAVAFHLDAKSLLRRYHQEVHSPRKISSHTNKASFVAFTCWRACSIIPRTLPITKGKILLHSSPCRVSFLGVIIKSSALLNRVSAH